MNDHTDPYALTNPPPPSDLPRMSHSSLLPVGIIPSVGLTLTILNLLWFGATACICGHTNFLTTVSSIPAFLITTGLVILGRYNPRWERLIGLFFWIAQGLLLLNNITDILWRGHSPWLR